MKKIWKSASSEYRKILERRYRLLEDKSRLIDRLDLTDEQKETIKGFFKKHPGFENKIDWNRKDLKWEDFSEILALEGNTKSSKKKYGLSGQSQIEDLVLDKDYKIIRQSDNMTIYYPLNFKASEVLAKPTTPPLGVTGKWCIAGKNYSPGTQDQHWNSYTTRGIDFFFIFLNHTKWAVARYPDNSFEVFDQNDNERQWDSIVNVDAHLQNFYKFPWDVEDMCEQTPHYLEGALFKEDKDGNRWSTDGKELVKVNDNLPVLIVPEGTKVIKWRAANHRTLLKKLVIPDNVKIEDEAFAYCWNLTDIQLGSGITTEAASGPFSKAKGKVSFTGNITEIPNGLFSCSGINQIFIPETVTKIGQSAFHDCYNLENIKLPRDLESIGLWAFAENRFQNIKIPTGVEYIGDYAFYQSHNLKEIEIPGSAWIVRNGLFSESESLEKIVLDWGIEKIGQRVFTGCYRLKELYLPGSLTEISPRAFENNYYIFSTPDLPDLKVWFSGTPEQFGRLTEDDNLKFLRRCIVGYTDQFYSEANE